MTRFGDVFWTDIIPLIYVVMEQSIWLMKKALCVVMNSQMDFTCKVDASHARYLGLNRYEIPTTEIGSTLLRIYVNFGKYTANILIKHMPLRKYWFSIRISFWIRFAKYDTKSKPYHTFIKKFHK